MDIFKLAVFLSSGIGQFIIISIIIGMFLPSCLLEIYGFIVGAIFLILLVVGFVGIINNLK